MHQDHRGSHQTGEDFGQRMSKNGKIKPITRMKKKTTIDTNGVLGETHEVGCTLKRSFVKIFFTFFTFCRKFTEKKLSRFFKNLHF